MNIVHLEHGLTKDLDSLWVEFCDLADDRELVLLYRLVDAHLQACDSDKTRYMTLLGMSNDLWRQIGRPAVIEVWDAYFERASVESSSPRTSLNNVLSDIKGEMVQRWRTS